MSADTDETVPISELMSRDEEDPCTKATRKLDWQQFYGTQARNGRQLLNCIANGQSAREIAGQLKLTRLTAGVRIVFIGRKIT